MAELSKMFRMYCQSERGQSDISFFVLRPFCKFRVDVTFSKSQVIYNPKLDIENWAPIHEYALRIINLGDVLHDGQVIDQIFALNQ